ncbi:MAG: bifunctional glutamate N-acetyltransferase/amino-acid acetyltransferase ArgJ [Acidobacteriaceae bacterium]|nr:bifunctional glutamate N-acetyltransferase/amino-acid acetyltransferase ArgJ [Acidobacteriaceae bacterium]
MTLPLGFRYAATYAGIRKEEKNDVGLIVADRPAHTAAVFTQNVVQAAPVQLCRKHLRSSGGKVSAVLVNAGNANCATRTGDAVALASCKAVAKALGTKTKYILPASTGVIGVELNENLLVKAVPKLVENLAGENFIAVAQAMMTTDTRVKTASETVAIRGGTVRIAGMTKGSGMIHPNMATTLGFIMTDADISAGTLREMLRHGTETSYNSLTVDGDMSTNDTVVLLASGAAGVKPGGKHRRHLSEAIDRVMANLAQQIAADGEGARKLVTVETVGFKSVEDARKVGRAIANSPLVKTAIAGSDPNWGRILSAAGYSGVTFDPAKVDIDLQGVSVCRGGLAVDMDEAVLKSKLDGDQVVIRLHLHGGGKSEARFFTCDLTEGYIQINGSYRT